jgi:oligosaccharide repeat unit polymerase
MHGYMDRLTPTRALVAGILVWLALFVIAPVEPRWGDSWSGLALYALGLAGLFFGFALPHLLGLDPPRTRIPERSATYLILIFTVLGMIGFAAKLVDFTLFRSVDFSTHDAIEARQQLTRAEGSNVVSLVAAAFLPFASAALALAYYAKNTGITKRIGLTTWIGALVPALLPLLMASRSSLLMLACFILVVSLNLTPRIQWRHVLTMSLGAVLISSLFAFLIAQRVEQSGSSMAFAARYSVYTYAVPLQPWSLDYINTGGSLAPLLSGYCSLLQYFLSGFFEFQYLVDLKDSNFAGGFYTFSFLPKLIAVVFGRSGESKLVDINADIFNPRPGVFQSFFGSLYCNHRRNHPRLQQSGGN